MIRKADAATLRRIIKGAPYFGVFISTAYSLYAQHSMAASFYTIDNAAVLMLMGHAGQLCGKAVQDEELSEFLHFAGITQLVTDGYVPRGFTASGIAIMKSTYLPNIAQPPSTELLSEPSIYKLVHSPCFTDGFSNLECFYSDTCMRVARGYAQPMALCTDDTIVATAGVYSMDKHEACISAVVTAKGYEGRGYASYLVNYLAHKYTDRRVVLMCEYKLEPFYIKLGFVREGTAISCKINNKGLLK